MTRALAANPNGHNHRPSSPTRQKPPPGAPTPGSPVRTARAVETPAMVSSAPGRTTSGASSTWPRQNQQLATVDSMDKAVGPSTTTAGPARSVRAASGTTAGFQRTSWYGAVSDVVPVGGGNKTSSTRLAASSGRTQGPGPDGNGVIVNPAVVKQGRGSNPTKGSMDDGDGFADGLKTKASEKISAAASKPFAEASSCKTELSLPRQSETQSSDENKTQTDNATGSTKKKGALTRLLRTPLSGGVLNSMKDADLPSVAVAARNLMELADYADLSTIMSNMNHRRTGYPFASTVDFATDADGYPVFCLTPLAMHTRNLAYNSRASLTVKMNGWGGLANARVTIFGDVHRLPPEYQTSANEIFKAKYAARKEASDLDDRWGDYTFYRMNRVIDVYVFFGFLKSVNTYVYCNSLRAPPVTHTGALATLRYETTLAFRKRR